MISKLKFCELKVYTYIFQLLENLLQTVSTWVVNVPHLVMLRTVGHFSAHCKYNKHY